ncbi:MAG: protein kinase domain-containing protein [Anaerolineales bacterium]
MDSTELVGQTIGNYVVQEKIGQGGMSIVYRGVQTSLNRPVAIKFLEHSVRLDPMVNQRFQREAQAIAQLRHDNIVQIYDFGQYEHGHYMVMEYVEGTDLRQEIDRRLKAEQAFTVQEILTIVAQVGAALDYAHARGIIHRDVKPGNVFLTADGQAILGDFGLAMLQNRLSQMTLGKTFGTPEYIAPEQAMDSRAATPQSDIYSLGGIVYELVTGALPFEAESALSLALKHVSEDPIPLRSRVPDLPPAVEAVVLKALSKEPDERFPSAKAFAEALRQAWEGQNLETLVVPKADVPSPPPPPPTARQTPPPARPMDYWTEPEEGSPARAAAGETTGGRRKRRWIPLVLVGILVVAGLLWFLLGQDEGGLRLSFTRPTETPSPTATGTPTPSPSPTSTVTATATEEPEATEVGVGGVVAPTATATPTPTPSPTATPSPTPTPTPTLAAGEVVTRTVDEMRVRFVPAGSFLMGAPESDPEASQDERPQHEVILSPFWMDETEVTTEQYKRCVAAGACEEPYTRTAYDNPARSDHPMTFISWEQAAAYCAWVGAEMGWNVALPTEAQWEKAASWDAETGTKRLYPWGDDYERSRVHLGATTAPVGSYPEGASPYGVLGLSGNAWEWVADWYDKDVYEGAEVRPDPVGPESGRYRVMRGGSFGSLANYERQLRTTEREVGLPESNTSERPAKSADLGFRCAVNAERLP